MGAFLMIVLTLWGVFSLGKSAGRNERVVELLQFERYLAQAPALKVSADSLRSVIDSVLKELPAMRQGAKVPTPNRRVVAKPLATSP